LYVLLGAGVASAANPARYRFHILDDRMVHKLSAGAQRTERAVVAFPRASGFVVATDPARPQRILILTNYHVAGEGPPSGPIAFRDGTSASAIRTVAANPNLDYALVEAQLTSGPRAGGVEPLPLERSASMQRGERIYAIGGHTGLNTITAPRESIAGGAATEAWVAKQIADGAPTAKTAPVGFRTIAVGRVFNKSAKPKGIIASGRHIVGVEADMPNAPGMSGSPVLSRETHKVVALHFGGFGALTRDWTESSVPIGLVLRDLKHGLERGRIDANARDLVTRLVDGR
jgi:hypothetical protein